MHQERRQAGTRRIGEAEAARVDRERVGQPSAIENGERRTLEAGRIRRACGLDDRSPAPGEHLRGRPAHFPADRPEIAVERGIPGSVGEQVVKLVVFVDALERGGKIVRVLNKEAAGVLGELREPRARVED